MRAQEVVLILFLLSVPSQAGGPIEDAPEKGMSAKRRSESAAAKAAYEDSERKRMEDEPKRIEDAVGKKLTPDERRASVERKDAEERARAEKGEVSRAEEVKAEHSGVPPGVEFVADVPADIQALEKSETGALSPLPRKSDVSRPAGADQTGGAQAAPASGSEGGRIALLVAVVIGLLLLALRFRRK